MEKRQRSLWLSRDTEEKPQPSICRDPSYVYWCARLNPSFPFYLTTCGPNKATAQAYLTETIIHFLVLKTILHPDCSVQRIVTRLIENSHINFLMPTPNLERSQHVVNLGCVDYVSRCENVPCLGIHRASSCVMSEKGSRYRKCISTWDNSYKISLEWPIPRVGCYFLDHKIQ
jgi:hypothetical protein